MISKKTILVVDDVRVNRNILIKILKRDGFETAAAENGKEALDILLRGEPQIALVLLDLTMPVMSGYDLLDEMKKEGILTSVPVIVTTGSDKTNNEVRSLEHGATDFITKPYNPDVVCHRVRGILRLCENAALLNRLETDRLTGVYSREFFYSYAQAMIEEHPDEQYEILCSNIENFKLINAKYGIEVGDELLKYIARHNMECVGQDGVCGRLGADSFVALRKRQPYRAQEEVGKELSLIFKDAPVKNFVIQYGLCPVEKTEKSVSSMCDCAQLALGSIKHKYGTYYAVYDDSMRQKMLREHQLSDNMEQALSEKQFVVYLQPEHDIETGAVAGAEALDMFTGSDPKTFDCILMDINMPVMDGYEATREIRASSKTDAKTIPIYAMTANAFSDDVAAALNAGMNGHIAKPVEGKALYQTLQRAFDNQSDTKGKRE